jgi:hypothetical protein
MTRPTCEICQWIDVRRWGSEGRLNPGQTFPCSWACDGEPFGTIGVRIEPTSAILSFRARSWDSLEWQNVEQRVPIVWTACHLGGGRPWFRCTAYSNGQYCGRRVAKLYLGGSLLFACRRCYGLAYASQLESSRYRGVLRAQRIRMSLGGSPNLFDAFPSRPKGMHRSRYNRLRHHHDVAVAPHGFRLTP